MTVLHLQTSMATSLRLVINTYQKRNNTMKNLNYQLKQLCYENRQGSYATQGARRYMLN